MDRKVILMSQTINYISGGKTGDLMHVLMIVKANYEKYGKKANLYIGQGHNGDSFSFPLQKVYEDIKDLIFFQEYINFFEIYNGQDIDINLNLWRLSPLLYKTNWIDILLETYKIKPVKTYWLEYSKISDYQDFTILHRSVHRHNQKFPWNEILEKEKCLFVTTNPNEASLFKSKYKVDCEVVNSISELTLIINSGKKFVGNMSAPLAIAHSLGKHRLAELTNTDQIHYIGDSKYLSDYWYVKDEDDKIPEEFFK